MTVPVYKRILDLFEAEGVNTLFGIPDPNFVHMFMEAESRGWAVISPHHEESAGFMAEAVSRMTGEFSTLAHIIAPAILATPGPSVPMHRPGLPVIRETASAMKPALSS